MGETVTAVSLAYALVALGLVIGALVAVAAAVIGVDLWIRWLRAAGTTAVVTTLSLTGGAALNTVVPRSCDDGVERLAPAVQRPLVAAVDGTGACHRLGLAQVALVPLVGVALSLAVASRRGPLRAGPSWAGPDGVGLERTR